MELGVSGLNGKGTLGPADTVALARRAEELGYTSWWASDHVVLPSPPAPGILMDPADPLLDAMVHLTYVAAATSTLELGTAVLVLPQRNPLVLAKQAASLDLLSGGRFTLGVGAGYLEPELLAVGVSPRDRGKRTDEYLDALATLWLDEAPEFHGTFVSFDHVDAHPRPVRPGGVPILVGGGSPAAYRRAVTRGHGWFGTMSRPEELERHLAGLAKAATDVDRPQRLGRLTTTVMQFPESEVTQEQARRYADLGVDRLVVYPLPRKDAADAMAFMERHADLAR